MIVESVRSVFVFEFPPPCVDQLWISCRPAPRRAMGEVRVVRFRVLDSSSFPTRLTTS